MPCSAIPVPWVRTRSTPCQAGALAGRGTALLLRLLWLRASARGKPALWEYLRELDAVTDGSALTDEARTA